MKYSKYIMCYLLILLAFYVVGLYRYYRFSGTADSLYFVGEDRLIYLIVILIGSIFYLVWEIKRGATSNT